MAEPNLTIIRGGLLALVSAHPRTSLVTALTAGVMLALLIVGWL
jgi:hypothetical protein